MTEYAFFAEKVDRWGKDMASLWGNFNICPQLHQLELPCHSQAELFSICSLKVWEDAQKSCHNIAYLLVRLEDTKRDRHYSISFVWVHPKSSQGGYHGRGSQKINCLHIQWSQLALCPSTAMQGSSSCTTPQEQIPRCSTSGIGAGNLLWVDQPTWSLPTACYQPPSHLPYRFEWAWWTHYKYSTRATGQWYKPYHKRTYLLGDWYPFTPSGGTRP